MPIDDAQLRQLVREGLSQREIARQTGLPKTTVQNRLKRLGLLPVQRAVQSLDTGAAHSVDTGAVHPIDTSAVQRIDRLEDEVSGLRLLLQSVIDRLEHPPVQTPVQITALPPYPKSKAVRWNLWLPEAIRDQLATWARGRGVSPSQLVTELLWKALNDRSSAGPDRIP